MRKNWFNRLLLSYLPVLFVVSLSLLLMTYLTLSEMAKRSAVRANELLSQSIVQKIDDALMSIDEMMIREILGNDKLKSFFHDDRPEDNRYDDYQTVAVLRGMMEENRFIDSVYLYRVTGRMVLTPSTFTGIDDFGDKEFVGRQLTSLTPHRWLGTRLYREQPNGQPVSVISLVKFANLSDKSMMVVNVRTDKISELIRKMSDSNLNFVELVEANGELLASKDAREDATEPTDKLQSGGKPLSSVQSSYTGWTVRSGMYRENIVDWVSSMFYLWISLGFLVIILGIVWLVYVTRRNYKPIRSITDRIEDYAKQKQQSLKREDKADEFKYIETAIEDLLDQSSLLQEENKENLAYRKRHVFLAMLEGGASAQGDKWKGEMNKLGLDGSFGGYFVVLIEMDRYAEFAAQFSRRDQFLLKHVLSKGNQELADSEPVQAWSEWVNPYRLAVVYMLEDCAAATGWEPAPVSEKLRAWVEENLTFTITIGIGTLQKDIEHVPESYRRAADALNYKSSLGTNRLIGSSDLTTMPQGEMFKQLHLIRALCQSFRSGDKEWEKLFHDLHGMVRSQLFSRDDLVSLLSYLIHHLHKEVMELPAELQDIWNKGFHDRLHEIAEQKENVDEIFAEFRGILEEASGQMRDVRENRHHNQLIHHVKKYIGENYANPDLSLAHLSDEFGVNASYLSRLFKEQFGEKFNDYVAQVRVEKAVELLRETEETVNDIAAAVGYTHTLTFIRVFKKLMGNTPGNYRKDMA
ncbi:helix-turn-helix domain-containing protein [Paenibacillus contaminans]|nr:helix-turn-helix domain-containing protein [Paenibacillus contaminans]